MRRVTASLLMLLMACTFQLSAVSDTFMDYQNFNHGYCPECNCYPCACDAKKPQPEPYPVVPPAPYTNGYPVPNYPAPCNGTPCATPCTPLPCAVPCSQPPCEPCAAICGTDCGVSVCAIAVAVAAVVAAAAIIVSASSSPSAHNH